MKGHPYLYGLIFLMVFFWSANYIVGKVALREFPPLLLSGVRVSMAGLLMLPIYRCNQTGPQPAAPRDVPACCSALGFFGVALNQLFFVVGSGTHHRGARVDHRLAGSGPGAADRRRS